jgi:hypothetical protein
MRAEIVRVRDVRLRAYYRMTQEQPGTAQGTWWYGIWRQLDDRFYELRDQIRSHPDYRIEGL